MLFNFWKICFYQCWLFLCFAFLVGIYKQNVNKTNKVGTSQSGRSIALDSRRGSVENPSRNSCFVFYSLFVHILLRCEYSTYIVDKHIIIFGNERAPFHRKQRLFTFANNARSSSWMEKKKRFLICELISSRVLLFLFFNESGHFNKHFDISFVIVRACWAEI